jgi:hypothetical protein
MPTRLTCLNNLRQIGLAYRVWSNDHGDQFPAVTNPATLCLAYYSFMANGSGRSPSILTCPADERQPDTNFDVLKVSSRNLYVNWVKPELQDLKAGGGPTNAPGIRLIFP